MGTIVSKLQRASALACLTLTIAVSLVACGGGGGGEGGDEPSIYKVTARAGAGGTITPESRNVSRGANTTFAVTPDSGYSIESVTGCGGTLSGHAYTTGAITADCTVTTTFTLNTHTVTASAGAGGTVTPATRSVPHGSATTVTVTPDADYIVDSVAGCGGSLSGVTYTTGAITADCAVTASFSLAYIVTATAGAGGNISPSSAMVARGKTARFTVTPDWGYVITGVAGCSGSLDGNTYTTGAINAPCAVNASFSPVYTVTASAGTGGTITPASRSVTLGGTATFTVMPDLDYEIDSVTGCGGTLSGHAYTTGAVAANCTVMATFVLTTYPVTADAGMGGTVSPGIQSIPHGSKATISVTPDVGYSINTVTGCGGSLDGNTYTTGAITAACSVNASFTLNTYTVTASAGIGGTISPATRTVSHGSPTTFTVTPDAGYSINGVTGCGGMLTDNTYTTGAITAACPVDASFTLNAPVAATLHWSPQSVKRFNFTWSDVPFATEYRLLENPDGASGYSQVATIAPGVGSHDLEVFLPARVSASYILSSCNSAGCTDSTPLMISGNLAAAIGYVKASNTAESDWFGYALALSNDGKTLAVGAYGEDSNATGIDGNQTDNSASESGGVYLFTRSGTTWSQQAYIKASNTAANDWFGHALALSGDGTTLAVGADVEDSNATGIDGNQADNSASDSGAVYVFTRRGNTWSQQAYLKASNTGAYDRFGHALALSGDGNTLAVGAEGEDGNTTGIDGNQADNSASGSGAVYVFTRSGNTWGQEAYVKSSNAETWDGFGYVLALASDGNTLAVGAFGEDSNATGINGNQADNSAGYSGAVYLFTRSGTTWSQQSYIKASNTAASEWFGYALALAGDGRTLAVWAYGEDSNATGIDGNQTDNSAIDSGAVYLFSRSGTAWGQQAYLKASNTEAYDFFGVALALSGDGNVLAVGAYAEDSSAAGIDGTQADNSKYGSGAVYLFIRSGTTWSQRAYVKAPNTGAEDCFGYALALAGDGNTLAVGAKGEGSNATGIAGNQSSNSAASSGAVYLY